MPPRGWWSPRPVALGQRERTKKKMRVGSESQFSVTGNPPTYLPHFPRGPSIIGLRPSVLNKR